MTRWIALEGAANARDVGGLRLAGGGSVRSGRLLRSDNLQGLTPGDEERLVGELGLRRVVDLRTEVEVRGEGPAPLSRALLVEIEHRSLHPETGGQTDVDAQPASGWGTLAVAPEDAGESPMVQAYLGYLAHRPDSIVAAVRAIARPSRDGAVLVHCAAGMDRTGVVVALALDAVGAERDDVVGDYVATAERIEAIIARLASTPTYASEVEVHSVEQFAPQAETMERFLALLDERHGGAAAWLAEHGLVDEELAALRVRLRGGG